MTDVKTGGPGNGYPYTGTYWTQPMADNIAIDANSSAMIDNLKAQEAQANTKWMLNDDSGGDHHGYNVKVFKATASTRKVNLTWSCDNPGAHPKGEQWDQWAANMPIDPSWEPPQGTDGAVTIIGPTATWSLWQFKGGAHPSACYGGKMTATDKAADNAGETPGVYPNRGGANATSMAGDAGAIAPSDIKGGAIRHALYGTIPSPKAGMWRWPATRGDGDNNDANAIPEGALLKLNVTQDQINKLPTALDRQIATAAATYGIRVADKTNVPNPSTFSTVSDPGFWSNYLKGQANGDLSAIPWDNLQVVDLKAASTLAPPGAPLTGSWDHPNTAQALPASNSNGSSDEADAASSGQA